MIKLKQLYRRAKPVLNVIWTLGIFAFTILAAMSALACGVQFWLVALVFGGALAAYSLKRWGLAKMTRYPLTGLVIVLLVGCGVATATKPAYQSAMEQTSNQIATKLVGAVPYPIAQMTDSLERRMLRERLLRFNQSDKLGYLYVFNAGVKDPIGYYTIQGKISATESQMSNPDQTWKDSSSSNGFGMLAESIGDDGSFGHEEGGENGTFWFTTSGVMGETNMWFLYTDAPVQMWNDVPALSSETQSPSSVSSLWKKEGGLGKSHG
jgi:hypothetical protein